MFSAESKWVLLKRRIWQFSTQACLTKLRGESANERVRKGNEQTSISAPKVRARTDVTRSTSLEARLATKAKIPCAWRAKCKISSCDYRHPPVCRNCKSEADAFMAIIACFDMLMVRRSPARSSVLKEQLRF